MHLRWSPPIADSAVAVLLTGAALWVGSEHLPRGWGFSPLAYVLTALIFLPLAVRRRWPIPVSLTSSLALLAYLAAGYDQLGLNFWGPLLVLYSAAQLRPRRAIAACWAVTVVAMYFSSRLVPGMSPWLGLVESVLFPTVACVFGSVGYQLAQRNDQLADLADRLRAEQEARAALAVAQERVHIARELHDVVAHHLSVISVQAGLAGYVFDADPPTARRAVGTIAAVSKDALHELRRLLVLLRVDADAPGYEGPGHDPAPGLADLPPLVDRIRASGVRVTLEMSVDDPDAFTPGLQLCAYRVTQEALTNVLKHAPAQRARVLVRGDSRWLAVVVENDGEVSPPSEAGQGLKSMRERAALYGGTLVTGPRPDGGYAVELRLPVGEVGELG
jgi:signal transduction histidine kinase